MEKIFQNGVETHKRPIKIKINDEWITFHFVNEHDREFYDIPKDDWRSFKDINWYNHMMQKSWFTQQMADFINANTKP